jgi:diguanylate cyclase (GGDEF)-like protein/hemerythrin-like metal-binding protein/PAS domain S-box-containing protein
LKTIDIFPWDENFNTGLSTVDKQHKKLVEILNTLARHIAYSSVEKDLDTILNELTDYTVYHFQTEEAIWHKHLPNDPLDSEHQTAHKNFVDTIVKLKSEQNTRPLIEIAEEALGFLARWLASHILEADRHMAYVVFALEDGLDLEAAKVHANEQMSNSSRLLIDIILSIYETLSSDILHFMRELKSHKELEEKVDDQNNYRSFLLELSTDFINLPLNEIDYNINTALEKMANFVGSDRAYMFDYDYDAETSSNTYEWCASGISPQIDGLQNVPMKFIPEWPQAHAKGEYILIEDVAALEEGPLRQVLFSQGIQSLVTFPLFEHSKCIGFVGFDAVRVKHTFSSNEISILELFSKFLSNVADRRHKEFALSKERSFLKTLFQAIPDLVWIKDIDGVYLSCNSRFEDFFGAKEADIVGKTDYDFVDKPLADLFRLNDNKVMQSAQANVNEEKVPFANDGHEEILQTTKVPMYDENGNINGVMGISRDITSIKETQKELETKEHYQRALLDNFPFMIWLKDEKNRFITVNQSMTKACGFDNPNDVAGKTDYDIWPKELAALCSKDDTEVLLSGKPKIVEEPIETVKRQIWAETYKPPVSIDGEVIGTVGYSRDITDRKELEIQTAESEKSLRDIFNNAQSGLMYITGDRILIKANQRLADILGYESPNEMIGFSMRKLHLTEENYIEYGKMNFDTLRNGVKRYIEYELCRKDGSSIWCELSGKAIDDNIPADMSQGVLWTINDISEKVELKKEQAFLQERLSYAIEGNNDGLWDWNLETNEIYYSPRWKTMLGYEDDELENSLATWEGLVNPDDKAIVLKKIEKYLDQDSDNFEVEIRMQHKDGHEVFILSRAFLLKRENDGTAIRLVGTHVDITQAKKTKLFDDQKAKILNMIATGAIASKVYDEIALMYEARHPGMRCSLLELKDGYLIHGGAPSMPQEYCDAVHGLKNGPSVGSCGTSTYFGTRVIVEDIDTDPKWSKIKHVALPHGMRSCWSEPIINSSGAVLGAFGMYYDYPGTPNDEESEDLTSAARLASIVMERDQTTKRIRIQQTENELKIHAKYLQSIIDGVDDPIMVINDDYTIEIMNETLKQSLSKLDIADPKHPKCYEVSHHRSTPCDGIEHPCPLRDVLETAQHTTVIHNHDTLDGDNRYIELSASPLFDKDNKCVGIIESARDITKHLMVQNELKEQKNILHYQANHDVLTGLPNRTLLNDRLEQAIEAAKRNKTSIALLFIDLDHFKEINDSLGHNFGDEILKTISLRLQEIIRDEDTVARLGGDEFTIILEELSQPQDASVIATKILDSLSKSINVDDNTLYVSCSIGISIYPEDGVSAQNLLKFADSAMYKAKDEGRNNFQYYNSTMTELAFERVVMETSLRAALKNEEFVVYYQPQMNGITDKLIGMEALVRWQHPSMGLVSPAKFIPLAESTGLIVQLDRFVMKTAMTQLSQWYKDGLNPGILAMNLTVKQLKQDDFIDILKGLIQDTGCKPEWLELEVTEGQIMTNPEEAIKILKKISDIGVELAIDDFGTGYSSLAYLKKLPIDKLKIDQAFVRDLPNDEEDAAIAKAVIALGKSLNLKVIAEGVETKEQRDFIVENNCQYIQGYFYSKPIPVNELEVFLKENRS